MAALTCSCKLSEDNIAGSYVAMRNQNTTDSLFVLNDGNYVRRLYSINGNLLLEQNGTWEVSDGNITLAHFFIDNDKVYNQDFPFEEISLEATLNIEQTLAGEVRMHYSPFESSERYYERVDG